MSQQIQTSGVLIPVIMVWIVTLAVGRPLGEGGKLPRAQGSEGLASATPAVSAHLWEDPLEVVGGLVRHPTKSEKEEKISKPSDFQQTPAEQAGEKLAIFVPLRGTLSTDHAEYRRRQRYAVQAALWCRGYRPDKPRKLASISLDFKRLSGDDVESSKNWCNIPYEDFRCDKDDRLPVRVRIYYLNAELVPDFVRGAAIIADASKLSGWRLTMTSPPSSDALSSILKQGKELLPSSDALNDSIPIRNLSSFGSISIYNTQATGYFKEFQFSSSHVMHRRMEGIPWSAMKVTVNQLIKSDDKVRESILEELKNRGVNIGEDAGLSGQPTRMALFAEWETTFGREFYKQFKGNDGDKIGNNVLGYFYLKGLDGQPPTDRRRKPGSDTLIPGMDAKGFDSAGDALIRLIEPPSLPIPVGPYQFDYLARLGQKLVDEDRDRRSDARGAIRAIGLLSTDLEDKLALLKILRPRFPEAIYFTNELEADFLQSENTKHARNLLVFTRYDLEGKNILTDQKLDCELPVFRAAFQVALVDAIWASLEKRSAPKPDEKRDIKLYEIGLRKAHPLEPVTPQPWRAWADLKPFRHLVFPLLILALILKANWLGRRVSPPETPTPPSHGPKGINVVWWSVISAPVVWAISVGEGWTAAVAGVAAGLFVEARLADNESFFQKYLRPKGFRWINAVWWSVISVPIVWAISVDGGGKAIVVGVVTGFFCYWVRCLPEPSVDWLRGFVFGPKKGLDLPELKEELEKSSVDAPPYESSVDAPPKPPPGRAVTAKGSPEGGRGTGAWWTGSILLALWGLAWWANTGPWSILMLLVSSGLALCLLCYRVSPEKISWKTLFGAVVLIFLGAAVVRWIMWEKIREPMVLADGVSVWPAVILRFVCALVALLSLRPIWKGLQLLQNECTGRFFFRSRMHACEKNGEQMCFLTRLFPVIDPRTFSGINAWQFQNQEKTPTEADRWRDYLIRSNPFERSSETPSFSRRWVVLSISGVLLTMVVMALFGFPSANTRGGLAAFFDHVSLVCVLTGLTLLCAFVARQILECQEFVRGIWSISETFYGLELEETLLLVAKITGEVTELIIYPFAICFILLCAHFSIFEQWNGLGGLYGMLVLALGFLLLVTWRLQRAANQGRTQTIVQLQISSAEALWMNRLVLQGAPWENGKENDYSWWRYTLERLGDRMNVPGTQRTLEAQKSLRNPSPGPSPAGQPTVPSLETARREDVEFQKARVDRMEKLIKLYMECREGAFGGWYTNPIVRALLIPGVGLSSLEALQRLMK